MDSLEKNFYENKEGQSIIIKKASEAPRNVKENPFYDEEVWGRAKSPDDIYLPDCDEALSFALAAHEIGHLSNEDEIDEKEITQDNFEGTKKEEERAWRLGKMYVEECIEKYYGDNKELKQEIKKAVDEIEKLMMEQVDLSKPMYLKKGLLSGKDEEDKALILEQKRKELLDSSIGKEIIKKQDKMKEQKIGMKPDWDKFTGIIKEVVEKILKDNERHKDF